MLRKALFVVAVLLIAAGLGLRFLAHERAMPVAIWGVVLLVALVVERWRYSPRSTAGSTETWARTGERFVDPESGQLTEVLFDARTGERRYVAVDNDKA